LQVDRNRPDLAIPLFRKPPPPMQTNAGAAANLGNALATEGRFDEALAPSGDALLIARRISHPQQPRVHAAEGRRLLEG